MPRKNVTEIGMYVSTDERQKLKQYAKNRGFKSVSDYLRSLVNADMKEHAADGLSDVVWGKEGEQKAE